MTRPNADATVPMHVEGVVWRGIDLSGALSPAEREQAESDNGIVLDIECQGYIRMAGGEVSEIIDVTTTIHGVHVGHVLTVDEWRRVDAALVRGL